MRGETAFTECVVRAKRDVGEIGPRSKEIKPERKERGQNETYKHVHKLELGARKYSANRKVNSTNHPSIDRDQETRERPPDVPVSILRKQQTILTIVNMHGQRWVHARVSEFLDDPKPHTNFQPMEPNTIVQNVPVEVERADSFTRI